MIIALPNPYATVHDVAIGVVMLGIFLTCVVIYNSTKVARRIKRLRRDAKRK